MSEEIAVRPFERENLSNPTSKILVEVFPTPNNSYLASWEISLASADDNEYSIAEIQALADACFAAGTQIKEVLQRIEDAEEDDDYGL